MIVNKVYMVKDLKITEYENETEHGWSLKTFTYTPSYNYIAEGMDKHGESHSGRAGAECYAIEHCENSIKHANMYKGYTTLERFEFLRSKVFDGGQVAPQSVIEAIQALLDEAIKQNKK